MQVIYRCKRPHRAEDVEADHLGPIKSRTRRCRRHARARFSRLRHRFPDNLLVQGVVLLALTLQISAAFFTDSPGPVPGAAVSRTARTPTRPPVLSTC